MTSYPLSPSVLEPPQLRPGLRAWLPLLSILVFQSIVALTLQNSAFQDEALYLYAGRQVFQHMLDGSPMSEQFSSYFSGLLYLYPLLAGMLDWLGGLEAARALSLLSMYVVTSGAYVLGRRLYDQEAGIMAAAILATQAPVLFLSRLATYDALCLALLAVAAMLAVNAGAARHPWLAALVPVVLVLAGLTKYAAALFIPTVIALLAWQSWRSHGWRALFVRLLLAAAMFGLLGLGLRWLTSYDSSILAGLAVTTTDRKVLLAISRLELVERALLISGAFGLVAVLGLLLSRRSGLLLALLLFGTLLLAPAYHVLKSELTSMHKHLAFGMFFAAPLAGFALARLSGQGWLPARQPRWLASIAVLVLLSGIGINQAQRFFHEWPESSALMRVLRTQIRPTSGRILAEEVEVPRYYLQQIINPWQRYDLNWFEYIDANGTYLTGVDAYKAALDEGFFEIVVLRYGPNAATANAIDDELTAANGYEQIAQLPFDTSFGTGFYWVWRKNAAPVEP